MRHLKRVRDQKPNGRTYARRLSALLVVFLTGSIGAPSTLAFADDQGASETPSEFPGTAGSTSQITSNATQTPGNASQATNNSDQASDHPHDTASNASQTPGNTAQTAGSTSQMSDGQVSAPPLGIAPLSMNPPVRGRSAGWASRSGMRTRKRARCSRSPLLRDGGTCSPRTALNTMLVVRVPPATR